MLAFIKYIRNFAISNTVRLVQLVEHQIVVLGVVGSSPTSHPNERTEVNSFRPLLFDWCNSTLFLMMGETVLKV